MPHRWNGQPPCDERRAPRRLGAVREVSSCQRLTRCRRDDAGERSCCLLPSTSRERPLLWMPVRGSPPLQRLHRIIDRQPGADSHRQGVPCRLAARGERSHRRPARLEQLGVSRTPRHGRAAGLLTDRHAALRRLGPRKLSSLERRLPLDAQRHAKECHCVPPAGAPRDRFLSEAERSILERRIGKIWCARVLQAWSCEGPGTDLALIFSNRRRTAEIVENGCDAVQGCCRHGVARSTGRARRRAGSVSSTGVPTSFRRMPNELDGNPCHVGRRLS